MTYQVLARKWRPQTFADLIGQEHVVKALKNALETGRLHHAYLLTGTRGVGKTTIARILAKSLNCENAQHGEPCGKCQSCRDIDQGRFVDLLEIDAASNTGIDNIREVLENAQYAPTVGKYKVYIIDEVHMLSKPAFNAMLKTLEEPPEHVKFILATTDPHKVPITILSRCLQFILRNMTAQQVSQHLAHILKTEHIPYQENALSLLGRAAAGSMRDALSLLDQAIAMGSGTVNEHDVRQMIGAADKHHLYELLNYLINHNGQGIVEKAREISTNAIGFNSILNDLALLLQQIALIKTIPNALTPDNPEYDTLHHFAQYFSDEQIQLYYQCVIHGKQDLALAPDEYAGFVMTLLRMLAFAPFAAPAIPNEHHIIENTQLHNPETQQPEHIGKIPPAQQHLAHSQLNSVPQKQFRPQDLPPPKPQEIRRAQQTASYTQNTMANQYYEDDTPPWEDTSTITPEPIITQPDPTFHLQENNELQSKSTIEHSIPTTTPSLMPELTSENWLSISEYIGKRVSAAQMLLRNLAWVQFYNGTLELAYHQKDNFNNDIQQEYITRIETALSEAYAIPIHIQINNQSNQHNLETPNMARERIKQENRAQAQHLLEQDAVIQKILHTFNAHWQDDSLQLKNNQ